MPSLESFKEVKERRRFIRNNMKALY